MAVIYKVGDATDPDLEGRFAIAHVLSDTPAFGAGFAAALAERYPRAKEQFKAWATPSTTHTHGTAAVGPPTDTYQREFCLGAIQWVGVGRNIPGQFAWWDQWVVNMVAQHGLRSKTNPHPLDLDALATCLATLRAEADDAAIVMPRIGCGLAGGTWNEVGPLVEDHLGDLNVYVYDLP